MESDKGMPKLCVHDRIELILETVMREGREHNPRKGLTILEEEEEMREGLSV